MGTTFCSPVELSTGPPPPPTVPPEIINISSKLNLTIKKGNQENDRVLFDAAGIIYPNRKEGRGITYFLTGKNNNNNSTRDFFVPYSKREQYKIEKIHFAIRHDAEKDIYNIIHYDDLGGGRPIYQIEVIFKIIENTVTIILIV